MDKASEGGVKCISEDKKKDDRNKSSWLMVAKLLFLF